MKRGGSIWVPAVFLVFAGVLWLNPFPFVSPVPAAARVPAWVTDPTPVRQPRWAPEYVVAGYTYRCNDCHRIIPSPVETFRKLGQHREIELDHGLNTRCFNCHHRTDRNGFVDDFGELIPWSEPQRVCGRCHGPVYRDWQAGSHGRVNGMWDPASGAQVRLKCIECHDPHRPRFPKLAPAPGPGTLRMGPQSPTVHDGEHDPLRVFGAGAADHPHP